MKLHRLLAITMLLLGRRRITGQELADRFEVSLRTIYRDLETINAAGIPIASYAGTDGGYEIMDQYRIEKQMVTADEIGDIATALKGMRSTLDDKGMDLLLEKVSALLSKSERSRQEETGETVLLNAGTWRYKARDKQAISQLRQAANSRLVVRFQYTKMEGPSEERSVEPVGIAWKGYAWYLFAYCRLREDYRIFRLSRIRDIVVLTETFPRKDVTLEELNAQWEKPESIAMLRLKLRFQPSARVRVDEYFNEDAITVEADGCLLVQAEQPENPWLYGMLLSYGANVRVLEPVRVADKLTEQARQILALYENETSLPR